MRSWGRRSGGGAPGSATTGRARRPPRTRDARRHGPAPDARGGCPGLATTFRRRPATTRLGSSENRLEPVRTPWGLDDGRGEDGGDVGKPQNRLEWGASEGRASGMGRHRENLCGPGRHRENLWDREQGSVGRILFGTQGDITRWTRTMYRHTIFRAILMLHNMIYFIVMLTKLAQIIDVNNRAPLFTVQRPRTHYSPCSILNKYSTSQVSPHPWYHNKIRRATLSSCVTSTTVKPYLIVAKLT